MSNKHQSEPEITNKWDRAAAMTVDDLLEETRPAAMENLPDFPVVSSGALELCAGRHAKAVVHGLLLASLRILTDCEDDGSFAIPCSVIIHQGPNGPEIAGGSRVEEVDFSSLGISSNGENKKISDAAPKKKWTFSDHDPKGGKS